MTTSLAERAELVQKLSMDVIKVYKCGLLTREEAIAELKSRGAEQGVYAVINPNRAEEARVLIPSSKWRNRQCL